MAATDLRSLLLSHAEDDRPGLRWREGETVRELSWREYVAAALARASALRDRLDPQAPPHVGVLLPNTPEMAVQLAAAALGGHVLVGLNPTRRGPALAADVRKADCQLLITDDTGRELLGDAGVPIIDAAALDSPAPPQPPAAADPNDLFMLIFTSGTSGAPKAVRVTHEKVAAAGAMLADRFGLGRTDTCYVAMPLFHSNAVLAGWGVALASGATIALAERFSASGFLPDVRRFGATYANYVGKPLAHILATPERPDDADNPLRVVFGNEASERDIEEFGRRFGCRVVDGFGSTENAVVISRVPGTPPGSLGRPLDGVDILDPSTGRPCPPAEYDDAGRVINLHTCVGELVNTGGTGQFAGYYNDPEATAERMRDGMYWSGDLAYRDADGWVWFAGRTGDWLRVDGENLTTAPVEAILLRHRAVSEVAVYAVPDPAAGDQLAAALVLREPLDPAGFEAFLAEQPDLSTKAWPRLVRLLEDLPRTATNKVLKRRLADLNPDLGTTWHRQARGTAYAPRQ